jgi:hypothetical protein
MRGGKWALALVLGLAAGSPAWAQRTFFGNGTSQPLIFQPVDTSQSQIPIAQPMQVGLASKLANFMPRLTFPTSNKPILGRSVFPTKDQMPGLDYLKQFGYMPGKLAQ